MAQYGKEVPYVFPSKHSISIEDAIQGNMICMSSLKDGFFADQERIVRLGLIKGSGNPI
jgi:hypothetical protein